MAASWWRRLTEGRWAQNLVNSVAVPRDRRLQESLDLQHLYLCARLYAEGAASASAAGTPELQRLLLEVHNLINGGKVCTTTARLFASISHPGGLTFHRARQYQPKRSGSLSKITSGIRSQQWLGAPMLHWNR